MVLKLYKAIKQYPAYVDIAYCYAENEKEALVILEWFPKEEHCTIIEEVIPEKGYIFGYQVSNDELARRKELAQKADFALGGILNNGGVLDKEQCEKFLEKYREDIVEDSKGV